MLRVLYASAKHAKDLKDKPKASKSKQEHYHSVLSGFTAATVASYDKLVTRFGSEAEFAPIIFELPQLMVADAFAAAANPFKRMCKSLKTCFLKATDALTLQPIAASLASLQITCNDVVRFAGSIARNMCCRPTLEWPSLIMHFEHRDAGSTRARRSASNNGIACSSTGLCYFADS